MRRSGVLKVLLCFSIFFPSSSALAATYYVDPFAANDAGTGASSSPKKYVASGLELMASGDTLILKDGVYTGVDNMIGDSSQVYPPSGTAGNFTTIKAEHVGQAVIDGEYDRVPCRLDNVPVNYLHVDGIHFRRGNWSVFGITGTRNWISNCGMEDGMAPTDSSEVPIAFIGGGSSHILVEDCWVWGKGRYGLYTSSPGGGTHHIIFRRVVVRLDDTPPWMVAALRFYNAQNNAMQNCMVIDNEISAEAGAPYCITQGGGSSYMGEYNHLYRGNVVLNNPRQDGLGNEDGNTIQTAANNVLWDTLTGVRISTDNTVQPGFVFNLSKSLIGGSAAQFGVGSTGDRYNTSMNLTDTVIANTSGSAFGPASVSRNLKNVITYGNGNDTDCLGCYGAPTVSNPFTAIKHLPRYESGSAGPNIIYQIGVPGSFYGDSGWNIKTGIRLWPFANEGLWAAKMKAYTASGPGGNRGFAAVDSATPLTDYIWGYLGHPKPDIYGSDGADTTRQVASLTAPVADGAASAAASLSPVSDIAFVQVAAATPQTPTQSVTVTYPLVQQAGNLNIVVVGWNDTTSVVQSVTDSAGNVYAQAAGQISGPGVRQSIYHAGGIRSAANKVTVTFNQAAVYPDIRILEYAGVSTPDRTAAASGTGSTSGSGPVTTTAARELIFSANTVTTFTSGAGAGFTSRIVTSPDGDIAQDRIVGSAGTYNATAPLSSSGGWVMQTVTFR